MERKAEIKRKTKETDIVLRLILESMKQSKIDSGIPFFDHMLSSMSKHGRFLLDVQCKGDFEIDGHHSIEDIGICFGKAFKKTLGDMAGCSRFGDAVIPMDDALALVAIDIGGRPHFKYSGPDLQGQLGEYSEELTIEFIKSFAHNADINIHIILYHGENRHHIHEAIFKAVGVSIYKACSIDAFLKNEVQSTKGVVYDNSD